MNLRRLLIILGFIAAVAGVGLAIYFVFFRPTSPGANGNENVNGGTLPSTNLNVNRPPGVNGNVNGLPFITSINVNGRLTSVSSVAQGGLTVVEPVSSKAVGEPTLAPNGRDLLYFDPDTGQFFKLSPSTKNSSTIADQAFIDAESVTWSPSGDKAIVSFPDDSKIVYDFTNRKQYTLPKEAQDFSFDPTSSQIAFKLLPANSSDRWLAVSKADGTEIRLIEPLGDQDASVDVNWSPGGQVAALFRKGLDATRQEIVPVGLHGENFKSFITEGRGFEGSWSPSGGHLLYSAYSPDTQYNPTLYLVEAQGDAIGQNRRQLGLNTWPDKCSFSGSGSTLYCAVPQYLDPGSGLYRDTVTAPDDFYQVDLASGRVSLLAQPVDANGSGSYRAQQLVVSSDGSYLYFRDANTGRLVQMRLK